MQFTDGSSLPHATPVLREDGYARSTADAGALNGWLAGKVKPTFQSLLKVRDFLERQAEKEQESAAGFVQGPE